MIDKKLWSELRAKLPYDEAAEIYLGLKHSMSDPGEHVEQTCYELAALEIAEVKHDR